MSILRAPTPAGWADQALAQLPALLVDHAHCEKKAAAQAMALIAQYGHEQPQLVQPLAALAQEELRHFRAVFRFLQARGWNLGRDGGDPYVKALLRLSRDGPHERLVDRLLLTGLVEARSAERLALLGQALITHDAELAAFYQKLARTEAGHFRLFVRLAKKVAPERVVLPRLAQLAAAEAEVMLAQPLAPRMH